MKSDLKEKLQNLKNLKKKRKKSEKLYELTDGVDQGLSVVVRYETYLFHRDAS